MIIIISDTDEEEPITETLKVSKRSRLKIQSSYYPKVSLSYNEVALNIRKALMTGIFLLLATVSYGQCVCLNRMGSSVIENYQVNVQDSTYVAVSTCKTKENPYPPFVQYEVEYVNGERKVHLYCPDIPNLQTLMYIIFFKIN